jgi:hypothetical protein
MIRLLPRLCETLNVGMVPLGEDRSIQNRGALATGSKLRRPYRKVNS